MHPLVSRILENRNIEDVEAFLSPIYEARPDPFLMKGMEKATERILKAVESEEKIAAWTDYDCDGIPAGAMLADFFEMIGHSVHSYIPERSEGYGLNKEGILKLKDEGVSLIVTADVGITNIEEVAFAASHGVDVIVTDHHLPGGKVPDAVAVLNPHQSDCSYPFKELSGTGVAFKLIEGLVQKGSLSISNGAEKWLLDLVALATVADMMPLVGENRTLVHYGLVVLKKGKRKGLRALLQRMRIPLGHVTEDDFSFSIAPKINAASRMKSPLLGLELLTTKDDTRADELARDLIKLNDARKLEGARVSKEVKRRIDGISANDVIVLGNPAWNPALLGIAATNIVDTYQRTVCLWGRDGDVIKGSCRSDGSINVVRLMNEASHLFEDYGGHELSGGFALKPNAVHELSETLQKAYVHLDKNKNSDNQNVQSEFTLTLSEVNEPSYRALRTLAPFGIGNEKPLFEFNGVRVERVTWFGKHKDHVRLTISDDAGYKTDVIGFFVQRASYKHEIELLSVNDVVSIHAALEQSFFAGRKELRLRLEHVDLITEHGESN